MQETRIPDIHIPEPERFRSQAYLDVLDKNSSEQTCQIETTAISAMHASAERHYPLEACGLLIGRMQTGVWHIDEAREVPNLNSERAADRFILDPDAYRKTDRELVGSGREIIGIYHSHPDCPAKPSPTDLSAAWDGFAYIIVSTCNGAAADTRCWALNASGDRFQQIDLQDSQTRGD